LCATKIRSGDGYFKRGSSKAPTPFILVRPRCIEMKFDITTYVATCGVCQMVKAEHKRPAGLLKPLEILEWKWEHITMDLVVGLPHTP
jgi:hypothetical protein